MQLLNPGEGVCLHRSCPWQAARFSAVDLGKQCREHTLHTAHPTAFVPISGDTAIDDVSTWNQRRYL